MNEKTHPLGVFAPVGPSPETLAVAAAENVVESAKESPARAAPPPSESQAGISEPSNAPEVPKSVPPVVAFDDYLRGGWYRPDENPSVYRSFVQTLIRERIC